MPVGTVFECQGISQCADEYGVAEIEQDGVGKTVTAEDGKNEGEHKGVVGDHGADHHGAPRLPLNMHEAECEKDDQHAAQVNAYVRQGQEEFVKIQIRLRKFQEDQRRQGQEEHELEQEFTMLYLRKPQPAQYYAQNEHEEQRRKL